MNGIFITGTDTGVGKTFTTCGLISVLANLGKRVGVLKPAETGCRLQNGILYPDDATRLAAFAYTTEPLDLICPYRFAPPLAPSVAAAQARVTIDPDHIGTVYRQIAARHDVTLVEGAGGLLVPLVGRYTFANLARDLSLPVLVVVGSKLGALNHTLLTLHYAQSYGLRLLGYIVNHPSQSEDEATRTNARTLQELTEVPCLGVIPHTPLNGDIDRDRQRLQDIFDKAVDLSTLLR
jgi:dethiobiotin synthetase